jgi:tryptophan synthase alpha subunit
MHLCANVMFGELLPSGTIARRNFSFQSGEKGVVNRLYRKAVDNKLAKRHYLTDYFFSLAPLEPRERLERIISLAGQFVIEVETHPVNEAEHRFLIGDDITRWRKEIPIASGFAMPGISRTGKEAQA